MTDQETKSQYAALVNLEAERTILGAVLVDNSSWVEISDLVQVQDYFDPRNKIIHESYDTLSSNGMAINFTTLRHALASGGHAIETSYLSSLVDGLPRISNVKDWCQIVLEKSRRRKAVTIANRLLELASDETHNIDTSVDSAMTSMMSLADSEGGSVDVPLAVAVKQAIRDLETYVEKKGIVGWPTSLEWLDARTGGTQRGDLFIIAARPSCGKSVMSVQDAIAACRAGAKARLFSMEMSPDRVARRVILSEAEIDKYSMLRHDDSWERINRAYGRLLGLDIVFDSRSHPTVAQIRASAIRQKKTHGLDILVVDHIQRVSYDRKLERRVGVGEVARGLKSIARDLDIAVLCTCQLNRTAERQEPSLAELAESGDIEREADIVFALHPDQETKSMSYPVTKGILLKNRDGATGKVDMYFEKTLTRFIEAKPA